MLLIPQILVRTFALGVSAVALVACGQQGPLYLPSSMTTDQPALHKRVLPGSGQNNSSVADSPSLPRATQPATATSSP